MNKPKKPNPWNMKKTSTKSQSFNLQKSPTFEQRSAEVKFKEAHKKLQAAVQKHVQDYESSSDEEELEVNNVIGSILKNYTQYGGCDEQLERTQAFLEQSYLSGAATCLICISKVKRDDEIWSCLNCYGYFHLLCIQRWAKDTIIYQKQTQEGPILVCQNKISWGCPKCRYVYSPDEIPANYFCFCKKVTKPKFQQYLVPHSCGEICKKDLVPKCGHQCLLLCHPGPCPPCPVTVNVTCFCGSQPPRTQRCSKKEWSCNNKCGKLLSCEKHTCADVCHSGDCKACPKKSIQKCMCKAQQKLRDCASPLWQCEKVCNKPLECGHHKCPEVCHAGVCDVCEFTKQRSCPCGKSKYQLPCTEETPTCKDTCEKILDCGAHTCNQRCHKDKCGTCLENVKKQCRCGLHTKEVQCFKPYFCETKCKNIRDCNKHPCNRRCCDGNCPPCEKPCGKTLSCGNHKCLSICHRGPCYPCSNTDTVTCKCGYTKLIVPCGRKNKTKPPKCSKLCITPSDCHHENRDKHRCHFGDCPPCKQTCNKINLKRKKSANATSSKSDEEKKSKYKFNNNLLKEHFVEIVDVLDTLAEEGNAATRKSAYQMHAEACISQFIVPVTLIAKYSAVLEPVANILQKKTIDIVKANKHIQTILQMLKDHREKAENVTAKVLREASDIAKSLNVDITIARIAGRQKHRSNPSAENASEFWKTSLIIPYLDSIIVSLQVRFSEDKSPAFSLTHFHPDNMKNVSLEEWKERTSPCLSFYNLEGFKGEAFSNGGRLPYLWLGIFLHGVVIEMISYVLPDIDNFWHSQTPIMFLGLRLPLHIMIVYICFYYQAVVAVAKMRLPKWSEPLAVGLAVVLIDIPYDIIGVNYIHWTWHDTDPNIADRHYWVPWNSYYFHTCFAASFIFWFHYTRTLICKSEGKWIADKSFVKEILCTLIAALLGTPGGILMFVVLYHPMHDIYNIHSEVCFFILFAFGLLIIWTGDRSKKNADFKKTNDNKTHWSTWVIVTHLIIHYLTFLFISIFLKPENEISMGLREPIGPCDKYSPLHTAFGMVLQKRKYLCPTDYDEKYFNWNCIPSKKPPSNGSIWYTICASPLPNSAEIITLMTVFAAIATVIFTNLHFGSSGDNVFSYKETTLNKPISKKNKTK
ncbi:unnamed protein product [Brassicogethes aeneus]|uniref:RING-type domain-containing protein n=1 Tax=Brassicogethes aeneus TaxID=1431903 RepID=A0A9P0FCB4_BRAAE|nr:unnamed protein product [Brassicogethes aeneus]